MAVIAPCQGLKARERALGTANRKGIKPSGKEQSRAKKNKSHKHL